MGKLIVLCARGDRELAWDEADPESVEVAREVFETLRKQGCRAYVEDPQTKEGAFIPRFTPGAEEIVVVRPLVGG